MKNGVVTSLFLAGAALLMLALDAPGGIICTNLYQFTGFSIRSGAFPYGTLIQGTNGLLYGTTLQGGTNAVPGFGMVFDATTNTPTFTSNKAVLTVLHSFGETDGGDPYAGLAFGPDGNPYGTTSLYGITNTLFPSGMGSVFGFHSNGFDRLYRFGTVLSGQGQPLDGAGPRAPLVSGPGGFLYGTTYNGGTNGYANGGLGYGTLFKITTNGSLTELHSFLGSDGANPTALALGSDGKLYGTASYGGAGTKVVDTNGDVGFGTIFKTTTSGTVTVLYSFGTVIDGNGNALDGSLPNSLMQAGNGVFYGTTFFGGSNTTVVDTNGDVGYGTIFQLTTNGSLTTLYSFGVATNIEGGALDGANPVGPLAFGADGNLYGVTQNGGLTNSGTIFRITTNGALTTLFSFGTTNETEIGFPPGTGNYPRGGLLLGADGHFYGTTSRGGTELGDEGTLFQVGPPAPEFSSGVPNVTVVAGATNTYAINVASLYTANYQWQFNGTNLSDGGQVSGSTTADLTLTGLALTNTGTYTLVASSPRGTNEASGVLTVVPVIIKTQPAGATIPAGATNTFSVNVTSVLPPAYQWRFNSTNLSDGGEISGSATSNLTVSGAMLSNSGTYSVIISNSAGSVTSMGAALTVEPFIVESTPASLTVLAGTTANFIVTAQTVDTISYQWQFDGGNLSDAGNVSGSSTSVLTISNATMNNSGTYSVAVSNAAGSTNFTVFLTVINPTAAGCSVTNLHSFTSLADGGHPNGLMLGHDGALYGTTSFGGTNSVPEGGGGDGTFFQFTTDGTLATIYSFAGGSDEADPSGPLVEDSNSVFYGTTASGINGQYGTVFAATTNGALTTLMTFYYTNGAYPEEVTLGNDGNLYGTIGPNAGTLYSLNPGTENFTSLFSFGGTLGSGPSPGLLLGADGNFYGSTTESGGTLFVYDPNVGPATLFTFTNLYEGVAPEGVLLQTSDGTFYGTTSEGGAHNAGTVFKFSTNGGLTTLYSFGAVTNWDGSALDGSEPIGGLALGLDGNLYGTTYVGGYSNSGTVFRITTNGVLTTLVWLNGSTGTGPSWPLALGPDGNFYGTTEYGGDDDFGTIFQVIVTTPPQIQLVSAAGGVINLTWSATIGQTYQAQSCGDLSSGNWVNLGASMVAASTQLSISDGLTNSQRFYRVAQVSGN